MFFCCESIMEIDATEIQQSRMRSELIVKDDISICDHTKKKPSRIVSLYSHGFIIVGVLHMCFRSNHKCQAYVNVCKKIIYPSASLYKVCSKKRIFVPGHWVIVKSKERERRVESGSSVTTTPSSERLFLIQMNGAKVGAKESGHHAACDHLSKQR